MISLVFYKAYKPSFTSAMNTWLVQKLTHGPYVHVAIKLADNYIVWADLNGVKAGPMLIQVPLDIQPIALIAPTMTQAVAWLEQQVGDPYGYVDLIDQALDVLIPSNTIIISQTGHYDCSNLATAFLNKAGVTLPQNFLPPYNVSPNDLAEFMGLLPQRKRISS